MKALGICIGASTLSMVELVRDSDGKHRIAEVSNELHHGNPSDLFLARLAGMNPDCFDRIAVTGRTFRNFVNLSSISEPEAVERALLHVNGPGQECSAVVSAGGETFIVYFVGKDGTISSIQSGNKCASGTGEFFLQQIRRMGLPLEQAVSLAGTEDPYRVSGRCSVFCKSDCTHALNKGVPKGRVVAGLCRMMAGKVLEVIKQAPKENIMVIGGCARNDVMIEALKETIEGLIVPDEAPYFEALGAALWATEHETAPFPGIDGVIRKEESLFSRLKPLGDGLGMVEFKEAPRGVVEAGDECILGLDVGSTTTKAVLLRTDDDGILASIYLRTQGDPVGASRKCYGSLMEQLGDHIGRIRIAGLGVTGSGRQIAGLHAMTGGIINEIIAHAAGALYFDRDVDTIFEIGGQDAKYTSLTNGVASDYAMNEACSAGTGSFLEEAAWETMAVRMEDIADIALKGTAPPNFNDQCAAFISSDIKNAASEGISREDIVAGLVYSVCMNYNNRVRGYRPAGNKVFMQGGVCYNRAVPLAMALLTGKPIIVPPDPGLIGAFGVAIEVKRRISLGLMEKREFSLEELRDREIEYRTPFVCRGHGEECDRRCEVARIRINGTTYPFGGACNRWYNLRHRIAVDAKRFNLARHFESLIFEGTDSEIPAGEGPLVAVNKSFMVNTYYPLYRRFFENLGCRVVLAGEPRQEGLDRKNAPFCWPAELAHGFLYDVLEKNLDYLFLPQFKADTVAGAHGKSTACPLCQGEPYYLTAAFKDHDVFHRLSAAGRILDPVIDFSRGIEAMEPAFRAMARRLGRGRFAARRAFRDALVRQRHLFETMRKEGRRILRELEDNPDDIAVVLFGRPYNAFVTEANMGIPNKFASRGVRVVPLSYLEPDEELYRDDSMYWSSGGRILATARLVRNHPQLFGCFITNFSCGPDSFILGYFRDIMGRKPSLTLELDSHVADAGLETRIEAFLDIVDRYRELERRGATAEKPPHFRAAEVVSRKGDLVFVDSRGEEHPFFGERVHLLMPSMGRFLSEAGSAVFRGVGMRSTALPPPDDGILRIGRSCTTCKECLPLLLTAGGLVHYMRERTDDNEMLVYLMPTAAGPCRFGQYSEFLKILVKKNLIKNTAIYSPDVENSYADRGLADMYKALWQGLIAADAFQEIYSVLLTNAVDVEAALKRFGDAWSRAIACLEQGFDPQRFDETMESLTGNLSEIRLRRSLEETPVILLTGEIYVRNDDISRQHIIEELARQGFAVRVASVAEWIYYTHWCVLNNVNTTDSTWMDRLRVRLRARYMRSREKRIRSILSQSGLCSARCEDVEHILKHTMHLMKPDMVGEAILTIGTSLNETIDHYCGAIAIGPFGCMPNRIAEAVLAREMTLAGKLATGSGAEKARSLAGRIDTLPFLAIESDGSRFPQIITARLEAFLLQAARLHELQAKGKSMNS